MTTMKAVRIRSFGGPEVLEMADVEKPTPRDDEVLIRVRAASVNPVDYKIRSGTYPVVKQDQLPKVLGRDVAGEVERCGSAVRNFKEGDTVYAMLDGGSGGYAEYVTVKADLVAPKPGQCDYRDAAAVPLAGLTAWQGLFDHGHLQAGQRVLIHGAGGGVGHLAVQFAKARGATVVATAAPEDVEFVRHLGADQVIDYTRGRFEESIQGPVDLVLDLVAGETQERSWEVLKDGGAMISSLASPSQEKARERHARAENFIAHPDRTELIEIGRLIDEGRVHPHVSAVFELREAREAQLQLEQHHAQGKVVLQVG
ncbi:MAG TPA: NADP-dependent oxidoreductase [Steroidobacteraceae bacterium]|nr:NADP-dependent oxidoreductase [Steroidobacteraceae bacterium]